MESATLESLASTDGTSTTTIDQALVGVIQDERAQTIVHLFKHEDISAIVFDNVVHRWTMSRQSAKPLFRLDRILFVSGPDEFANRHETVIPELQTILGDLPGIELTEIGREDGELVIEETRIEEGEIIPCRIVTQPDIRAQHAFGHIDEETSFSLDEILGCVLIVEDVEDFRATLSNELGTKREDNAEVCVEVTRLDIVG